MQIRNLLAAGALAAGLSLGACEQPNQETPRIPISTKYVKGLSGSVRAYLQAIFESPEPEPSLQDVCDVALGLQQQVLDVMSGSPWQADKDQTPLIKTWPKPGSVQKFSSVLIAIPDGDHPETGVKAQVYNFQDRELNPAVTSHTVRFEMPDGNVIEMDSYSSSQDPSLAHYGQWHVLVKSADGTSFGITVAVPLEWSTMELGEAPVALLGAEDVTPVGGECRGLDADTFLKRQKDFFAASAELTKRYPQQ